MMAPPYGLSDCFINNGVGTYTDVLGMSFSFLNLFCVRFDNRTHTHRYTHRKTHSETGKTLERNQHQTHELCGLDSYRVHVIVSVRVRVTCLGRVSTRGMECVLSYRDRTAATVREEVVESELYDYHVVSEEQGRRTGTAISRIHRYRKGMERSGSIDSEDLERVDYKNDGNEERWQSERDAYSEDLN